MEGTDALLIKAGSVGPLRSTVEWTTRCCLSMNATRFPTLLVRYVSPRRRTHFALFHGRGTAPAAAHTVHAAPECARAVYLLRQGYCVAVVTFALVELTCGVRAPLVLLGRPTTGRSKLVWCGPRASWCGRAWPLEPHHQRLPLLCLVLQQINRSTVAVRVR